MKVKDYYFQWNENTQDIEPTFTELKKEHIQFEWINYNDMSVHYGEILGIYHEVNAHYIDRFYLGWYGLENDGSKRFRKVIGFNKLTEAKDALQKHVDKGDFFGDVLRKVPRSH